MPETWVRDSAGVPVRVKEMWAGTDSGQVQMEEAWIGDDDGIPIKVYQRVLPMVVTAVSPRWYQITLSWTDPSGGVDSYKVYWNSSLLASVTARTFTHTDLNPNTAYSYRVEALRSGVVVGEATASATTPAFPVVTLTATAASTSQINLSWTTAAGATKYVLESTSGLLINKGTLLSHSETGLAANTTYSYTLTPYYGNKKMSSATASAKTLAPQFEPREATLTAVESASYTGSGSRRGSSPMYFGYYSSNQGTQKSQFRIAVPADLRNCVSVDKVEVSIMGRHTYLGGGTTVGLVVHHNTSLSGSYGGNTGVVTSRSIGKPGYFGGTEWVDVTSSSSAGRYTVAEEFRIHGAQGFGLVEAVSGQSGYGYADGTGTSGPPRVRFKYTVRV